MGGGRHTNKSGDSTQTHHHHHGGLAPVSCLSVLALCLTCLPPTFLVSITKPELCFFCMATRPDGVESQHDADQREMGGVLLCVCRSAVAAVCECVMSIVGSNLSSGSSAVGSARRFTWIRYLAWREFDESAGRLQTGLRRGVSPACCGWPCRAEQAVADLHQSTWRHRLRQLVESVGSWLSSCR